MSLLSSNRNFRGHVGAQFFGAFNDNLFKQLILLLAARFIFPGEDKQAIAFVVFALPFVLFSGLAGDLSERWSKRSIIINMKVAEIGLMVMGTVALQLSNWERQSGADYHSWEVMLVVLFLMGTQSAFFGPAKYGIIPEIVKRERLLPANGIISMTTFLGVLLGQAIAGPLLDNFRDDLWIAGSACVFFAIVGTLAARVIEPLPPQDPGLKPHLNPFGSIWASAKELREDSRILPILLTFSFFWFNGGLVQQAINGLAAPAYLDIPEDQNWKLSILMVTLAVSIICGSISVPRLANLLSKGKMVMIGGGGILFAQTMIFGVTSAFPASLLGFVLCAIALSILGFLGAFLVVPIQTFLQDAPPEGSKGKAFAVNNFLNFLFLVFAGGFYGLTTALSIPPALAMVISGSILCTCLFINRKAVRRMDEEDEERAPALSEVAE